MTSLATPIASDAPAAGRLVLPRLRDVVRRAAPSALEAAVIPAAIVVVVTSLATPMVAIGAALAWTCAVIAWRLATRRQVAGMSILAAVRLFFRSGLAIAAGSTFVYFVQPMIGGLCLAAAFLVSVVLDRPLARRFARDFLDLPSRVVHDRRVHRFFRHVSVMWGVVGLANAATAFWLLTTVSATTFVISSTALSIGVTVAALAVSLAWLRRTIDRTPSREWRLAA